MVHNIFVAFGQFRLLTPATPRLAILRFRRAQAAKQVRLRLLTLETRVEAVRRYLSKPSQMA